MLPPEESRSKSTWRTTERARCLFAIGTRATSRSSIPHEIAYPIVLTVDEWKLKIFKNCGNRKNISRGEHKKGKLRRSAWSLFLSSLQFVRSRVILSACVSLDVPCASPRRRYQ